MSDTSTLLRCARCNKPFDKAATLKRHGYYCRSRKPDSVRPRTKSCIACVKSKSRCNMVQAGCTRCNSRGLECRYTSSRAVREASVVPAGSPRPLTLSESGSELVPGFGTPDPPDFDLPLLDWDDISWDLIDSSTTALAAPTTSFPAFQPVPALDFAMSSQYDTDLLPTPSLFLSSIPPTPSSNPRALMKRSTSWPGRQNVARLILHTLKSYPLMLRRDRAAPPFISPHLLDGDEMKALQNCISLMRILEAGFRSSRKLFWQNVRRECEKMVDECMAMKRLELLAAMQALSLYLLVRLEEGETEYNNLDTLLVSAVAATAAQFNSTYTAVDGATSVSNGHSLPDPWKDWLLDEYLAFGRISVVYQVVNMVTFFDPAAMCDFQSGVVIAPLPSHKRLWEAPDAQIWKTECARDIDVPYGLTSTGDLVKLDIEQIRGKNAVEVQQALHAAAGVEQTRCEWEEWCAGMDAFGNLVMLAAAFVGS